MAARKAAGLQPSKQTAPAMPTRVDLAMPESQFNSVVRFIKSASLPRVKQLAELVTASMKRLGKRVGNRKGVAGIPDGSDQVNIGSIAVWLDRIPAEPSKKSNGAVGQVVAIAATINARVKA